MMQLHETAGIDVVIVEHVADLVVPSMTDRNVPMPVPDIVAMLVIVVALFELASCVFEIVIGRCKVQRGFWVGPEFRPLPSPPHCLEHLVAINVPHNSYLFPLQLHLHRINPWTSEKQRIVHITGYHLLVATFYAYKVKKRTSFYAPLSPFSIHLFALQHLLTHKKNHPGSKQYWPLIINWSISTSSGEPKHRPHREPGIDHKINT